MNTKKIIFLSTTLFLFVACGLQTKKELPAEGSLLAPLDSGTVYYQDKSIFDTLIHLKGKKVLDDSLFYGVNQFFLKNGQLIVHKTGLISEHENKQKKFLHYSLPDLQFIKSADGTIKYYSDIVPSRDTTIICYLWSPLNEQLYRYDSLVTKQGELKLPHNVNSKISSMTHIGNNDFIYIKDSTIVYATNTIDSVYTENIHNLKMKPSLGSLIANISKNRVAFIYKYYQIIQIIDLETKAVKTIDFQNGNYCYDNEIIMDAPNKNTLYYYDAFAGEDYFYVLYWGYSPEDFFNNVTKGWK